MEREKYRENGKTKRQREEEKDVQRGKRRDKEREKEKEQKEKETGRRYKVFIFITYVQNRSSISELFLYFSLIAYLPLGIRHNDKLRIKN